MIIEKFQIKSSNIVIPANYVLVKLDPKYTEFQIKGKSTGIVSSDFTYDKNQKGQTSVINVEERNAAVFGEVIKAPKKLIFNRDKIRKITDSHTIAVKTDQGLMVVDWSAQKQCDALRRESVDYDTDVEVKEGDRVNMSYRNFIEARNNGMTIDTDLGQLTFVRYDMLKMVVDQDNNPVKMLNGFILVEPELREIRRENGVDVMDAGQGIVVASPTERYKKSRKNQIGRVVLCGTPVRGYLHDYDTKDPEVEIEAGERIVFDPRGSIKLENELHQVVSDIDYYIVRRRHIWLLQKNCTNFDEISLERLK